MTNRDVRRPRTRLGVWWLRRRRERNPDADLPDAQRARWTQPLPAIIGDEAILKAQMERLRQLQEFKATEPILRPAEDAVRAPRDLQDKGSSVDDGQGANPHHLSEQAARRAARERETKRQYKFVVSQVFGVDLVVRGERMPNACRESAGAVLHLGHHRPCPDCGAEWGTIRPTKEDDHGHLACRDCGSEFVRVIEVSVALTHEQMSAVESVARSADRAAAAVVRDCLDEVLAKARDTHDSRQPGHNV